MTSTLDQLRSLSVVVADTADFQAIEHFKPIDATTNPSLILKQAQSPVTEELISKIREQVASGVFQSLSEATLDLSIRFGFEIAKRIRGYVSTEIDARLSFNTDAAIEQAQRIIHQYSGLGIPKERILIKLASTWEGIQAARALEAQGIGCNLTLLFCEAQAIAAANAQATLISPFVGRIRDWYIAKGEAPSSVETDPGVLLVRRILNLYRRHSVGTIVMGASFRTADQVLALAGCDRLTISPGLLQELETRTEPVKDLSRSASSGGELTEIDRDTFLLQISADPMATEKLADGITRFVKDQETLESLLIN
jgi:transaldolase